MIIKCHLGQLCEVAHHFRHKDEHPIIVPDFNEYSHTHTGRDSSPKFSWVSSYLRVLNVQDSIPCHQTAPADICHRGLVRTVAAASWRTVRSQWAIVCHLSLVTCQRRLSDVAVADQASKNSLPLIVKNTVDAVLLVAVLRAVACMAARQRIELQDCHLYLQPDSDQACPAVHRAFEVASVRKAFLSVFVAADCSQMPSEAGLDN